MSQAPTTQTQQLLRQLCRALDEKKAADLRVLQVREVSSITDFLVLATGTSEPHLRALRVELEKVLDAAGARILGMDTGMESGWVVVDAFDIMIHVFTPENRSRYSLENLWKDAPEIEQESLLSDRPLTTKAKAKPAAKKEPAKRKATAAKKKAAPAKKKTSAAAKKPAAKKTSAKKVTTKPAAKKKR